MCVVTHTKLTLMVTLMVDGDTGGHMGDTIRGDDVAITGTGTYDDVDCDRFRVNGTGKVSGDLLAETATVNGTASVGGDAEVTTLDSDGTLTVSGAVRAETVELGGTAKVSGDLHADEATVDGTGKVGGDASVDHVVADGTLNVSGNLDGHDVAGDGTVKIGGSVVAADARFDGTVKIGGLTDATELSVDGTGKFGDVNAETCGVTGRIVANAVSARTFDLELQGASEISTLDADEVRVAESDASRSLGARLLGREDRVLEVDTVVGETVDLDATTADTVVGERVTLGPDADVGTVYADELDADDATVAEVRAFEEY